ncbi:MAG: DUF262 domain-containing protein [Crocinitomicaceae bacterium]|nr:DUF262 domain-containing protein [Crocinitomicaceae bacterium]
MAEQEKPKILSVSEVFTVHKNLVVPEYQRPYKWTEINVQQLIDDILLHNDVPEYRLGTIVLHKTKDKSGNEILHVVDGQQRLFTLSLITHALHNEFKNQPYFRRFKHIESNLLESEIGNQYSRYNLWNNHKLIQRQVKGFKEETIQFLFDHCKVVWVVIDDVSEAFQFFDSQNARGKDLDPHDLLKAFHLREMANNSEKERLECVADWEEMDQEELTTLFNDYLYKVRNWSKGRSARYFTKSDVHIFKGISLDNPDQYNFIKPYRINHFYTDKYNVDLDRKIDGQKASYPFQIDQIMINGKRFFEFVSYYSKIVDEIRKTHNEDDNFEKSDLLRNLRSSDSKAFKIMKELASYPGRNRTGDQYVRNIFDCCILYYMDKFGESKLDKAIEKFFIWTYKDRLEKFSVQLATIDNRGMEANGFFRVIREAIDTKDVFHKPLGATASMNASKTTEIRNLFNELNYWTGA